MRQSTWTEGGSLTQTLIDRDVMVPMRDGVRLATDVWRDPHAGPVPVILIRTAVSKSSTRFWGSALLPDWTSVLEAGFAVVWQDFRGTGKSEGTWHAMGDDPNDGEDTVRWLIEQPWCDGLVGGAGPSHMGMAQWGIASTGHPAYKAIVPAVAPRDYYLGIYFQEGGAQCLRGTFSAAAGWASGQAIRAHQSGQFGKAELSSVLKGIRAARSARDHLPLIDHPGLATAAPWWTELMGHPARDDFWTQVSLAEHPEAVMVPALNIGGWFDHCLASVIDAYQSMRKSGGTESAREGQRLIIGPWNHTSYEGIYPARSFGPRGNAEAIGLTDEYIRFYDRWLRGRGNAVDGANRVKIFVMGADEWREMSDWPPPDTRYVDYFLASAGAANSARGDGSLSTTPPAEHAVDTYLYDPRRPVPTVGGADSLSPLTGMSGPADQHEIEQRDDVLCYTSPVLTQPLAVIGNVSLNLAFSSSARDTDITAKLVDVSPGDSAMLLTEGVLRARYRHSLGAGEMLEPGEVYEVTVDMRATANVFLPGHRVRLEVSSSNYPRYSRNTNTGGVLAEDGPGDLVVAVNRVHHGPAGVSRLVLPVVSR